MNLANLQVDPYPSAREVPRTSAPPRLAEVRRPISERPKPEDEFTFSLRLIRPFTKLLRGTFPEEYLDTLDAMELDQRIAVSVVNQMVDIAVATTNDADIGLKAARAYTLGDCGAIDYVMNSAPTVRAAFDMAIRYVRLINDAVESRLEVRDGIAYFRFENRVAMPRQSVDFEMGATFRGLSAAWTSGASNGLRVLFTHAAPADVSEYAATFGGAQLVFGAPFLGFVFDAKYLDQELISADSKLHEVIRTHAEAILTELPNANRLTNKVRDVVESELAGGNPTVVHVAARLAVSPRTLERRLEREGTTFSQVLDDLRKQLAQRYVGTRDLDLAEVAFLLGFSQVSAFHRAFKRWTGQTPLHYRRAQRARF